MNWLRGLIADWKQSRYTHPEPVADYFIERLPEEEEHYNELSIEAGYGEHYADRYNEAVCGGYRKCMEPSCHRFSLDGFHCPHHMPYEVTDRGITTVVAGDPNAPLWARLVKRLGWAYRFNTVEARLRMFRELRDYREHCEVNDWEVCYQ